MKRYEVCVKDHRKKMFKVQVEADTINDALVFASNVTYGGDAFGIKENLDPKSSFRHGNVFETDTF